MNSLLVPFAWTLGTFAVAYGLGSIPFGLMLTRLGGMGDIRKIGSGNIGATNVMRTGKPLLGILTLLFDAAKGLSAVWIVRFTYDNDFVCIAALFAVLGHIFPVWLRFKGGKGVATSIGVLLGFHWQIGLIACLAWLVAFFFSRMASFASIAGMWAAALGAFWFDSDPAVILCLSLAALITFTHRANIERMLNGTEYTFKKKSTL